MVKKILLNGSKHDFGINDLPMLIHGKQGVGASLFTVSLVAGLYEQGIGVVFLSGFPMAREELVEQIGNDKNVVLAEHKLSDSKIIFIPRERSDLLAQAANTLPNFKERVVLIKNIDLFDKKPFESVRHHQRLILSGDLDKCCYSEEILNTKFATKVSFSVSEAKLGVVLPKLKKYQGYFKGEAGLDGGVEVNQ